MTPTVEEVLREPPGQKLVRWAAEIVMGWKVAGEADQYAILPNSCQVWLGDGQPIDPEMDKWNPATNMADAYDLTDNLVWRTKHWFRLERASGIFNATFEFSGGGSLDFEVEVEVGLGEPHATAVTRAAIIFALIEQGHLPRKSVKP